MFKTCSCGKRYKVRRNKYGAFVIDSLVYKGVMMGLALFDCTCGSTMGIEAYPGSLEDFKKSLAKRKAKTQNDLQIDTLERSTLNA